MSITAGTFNLGAFAVAHRGSATLAAKVVTLHRGACCRRSSVNMQGNFKWVSLLKHGRGDAVELIRGCLPLVNPVLVEVGEILMGALQMSLELVRLDVYL